METAETPNDPPRAGRISIETQTNTSNLGNLEESAIVVRARRPNKALLRVRVRLVPPGITLCQDIQEISVPQFFKIVFLPQFNEDLTELGLRRSSPDPQGINESIRQAIIDEILDTLRILNQPVNVRFMLDDPRPVVGKGNFSTVLVGGHDCEDRLFGTSPLTLDLENIRADNEVVVWSGSFADRDNRVNNHPIYKSIFDGLAVRDADGNPDGGPKGLPGTPVDVGDFADPPQTVRQRTVRAAIVAFAKLEAPLLVLGKSFRQSDK